MTGGSMTYLSTWLKGSNIVAEDQFEDLLAAQVFVLDHMSDYRSAFDADSVKVWNGRAVYFQWHPAALATRSPAMAPLIAS